MADKEQGEIEIHITLKNVIYNVIQDSKMMMMKMRLFISGRWPHVVEDEVRNEHCEDIDWNKDESDDDNNAQAAKVQEGRLHQSREPRGGYGAV